MSVRLPEEVRARLERVAEVSGLKAADLIRRAVEGYLAEIAETGELRIPMVLKEEHPEPEPERSDPENKPAATGETPRRAPAKYPTARQALAGATKGD